MELVVFVNPRSRQNRRDPQNIARLRVAAGAQAQVLAPGSLEELGALAETLAAAPPKAIAISGGDGTLHQTLTALLGRFGDQPLPPIAILPGGTMNVVARSLGVFANPETFVRQVAEDLQAGRPFATVARRCLRVGTRHGFVFGNGFIARFLGEYYGNRSYGPGRAVWILARLFWSALGRGPYARRLLARFAGRFVVDGQALPFRDLSAISAATVREVGLGFRLNHRADEDPNRFSVSAIFAGAISLGLDLWAVHRGRGISPRRARTELAARVSIEPEPKGGRWPYTIDGDLYESEGLLEVAIGPELHFVRPR